MRMATYQATLRAIQPIIEPLFDALHRGLDHANELHERSGYRRDRDGHYWAHAVRRFMADQMSDLGLLAESETSDRPALPLSSLYLRHGGVELRIFRGDVLPSGELQVPIPGKSPGRQAFWRQEPMLEGMQTDNILVIWSDDAGQLREPLVLARPVGGDHRRESLRLQWRGPLERRMGEMRAADLDELRPTWEMPELGDG